MMGQAIIEPPAVPRAPGTRTASRRVQGNGTSVRRTPGGRTTTRGCLPRAVSSAPADARVILDGVSDRGERAARGDLDEMQRLLEDRRDHRARPNGTFPEWCRARNRHYRFAVMVYHDK